MKNGQLMNLHSTWSSSTTCYKLTNLHSTRSPSMTYAIKMNSSQTYMHIYMVPTYSSPTTQKRLVAVRSLSACAGSDSGLAYRITLHNIITFSVTEH